METLNVQTRARTEFVDITSDVQAAVGCLGVADGVVTVFVPHTTAGVTINENADPDVTADMELVLDRVVPWSGGYAHGEGNTAAHVKASMMGNYLFRKYVVQLFKLFCKLPYTVHIEFSVLKM